VAAVLLLAAVARADDSPQLTVGGGLFELTARKLQTAEGDIFFRSGHGWFDGGDAFGGLRPAVGLMVNAKGAVMGWGGVAAPFQFADGRWEVEPAIGAGAYSRGNSKRLGGPFAFHLGLNVSYGVGAHSRVGLAFMHISNGGIYEKNPSVNSALVTWSWRFRG